MEQRNDMMCVKVYSSIVEAIDRVESMHEKLQKELEHRERVKQAFYAIQVKDIQLFLRTLTTIDINARDQIFQQTLLHSACSEGFNKVSQILLSKGADVNTVDLNYWTPLHTACNTGNLELINILLDHNAITSTKSRDGNIPLHYFTRCSSVSVTGHNLYVDVLLRLLRDNPSSVNEKNNQGETPLHEAAFRGSKLTIRYIIKYSSAKINITNNNGEAPLHYAIRSGNKQVVQFMLEMGSDPSINSEYSGTPLQLAIKENRQDFVQLIHKSISQNRVPRKPGTENDDFEGRVRDEYGFIVDRELEEMNEQAEYKRFKNIEEVKKNWKKYIMSNNMLEEIKNKSPQLQKLLNKGIPHELRGEIWFKLAQIRMQSPVTEKEYKYLLSGEEFPFAEEIEKDILRTFPGHNFFSSEGGKSSVRNILLAYSIRNPKVGYCQSMNFIVGLLLLCMPEDRAFNVLCYIVEDLLVGYFGTDMQGLSVDQRIIDLIIEKRMPKVFESFNYFSIPSSIITTKWMMCIFLNSTPTETTMRIWDCFLLMGAESLILVCISFIKMCEPYVEGADTSQKFVHLLNNSTRIMYDADQLLKTAMKCKLTLFEGCELSSLRIDFKAQIEAEREEMDKRRKKLENQQRERNNA